MSYRIACIDLGGTMIKSGLWDGTALSHTQQTPTHSQEGAQAVLDRVITLVRACLLYTSPSPRDRSLSRMPSSA